MAESPVQQVIQMQLPHQPGLYFNGFGIVGGATDLTVTLLNGNFQVATIQASPAVIKELAKGLVDAVKGMEKVTGIEYLGLGELLEKIRAATP